MKFKTPQTYIITIQIENRNLYLEKTMKDFLNKMQGVFENTRRTIKKCRWEEVGISLVEHIDTNVFTNSNCFLHILESLVTQNFIGSIKDKSKQYSKCLVFDFKMYKDREIRTNGL